MKIIFNLTFFLLFLFVSCNRASEFPKTIHLAGNQQKQKSKTAADENIILRSADGGQNWQDISEGCPEISWRVVSL
jgi:photosystem II stability/assembly factor-like uncharacterized protein